MSARRCASRVGNARDRLCGSECLNAAAHIFDPRADAKSLRQSLTHQFCLVFGGFAAKNQKKDTAGGGRSVPTPHPPPPPHPRPPTGSIFALALLYHCGPKTVQNGM